MCWAAPHRRPGCNSLGRDDTGLRRFSKHFLPAQMLRHTDPASPVAALEVELPQLLQPEQLGQALQARLADRRPADFSLLLASLHHADHHHTPVICSQAQ